MGELSWPDQRAGRWVECRSGLLERAPGILAEHGFAGFELFTTERAAAVSPALLDAADAVHRVPPGQVPEAAAALLAHVQGERLVALGGGRVIDTAKAIAAVGDARVAAIPTTLSGAEMTSIHRLPAGHEALGKRRAELVLADPELMTSAPGDQLRDSAMNALAHGADSLYTPLADGLSRAAALRGAAMIAGALDAGAEMNRAELALGALLCGHAIDSSGLAITHVLAQTVVRVMGLPHAAVYAAVLPATMELMRDRASEQLGRLADVLGTELGLLGERFDELGGRRRLGVLGADPDRVAEVIDIAISREDLLAMTPGELTDAELDELIRAAW